MRRNQNTGAMKHTEIITTVLLCWYENASSTITLALLPRNPGVTSNVDLFSWIFHVNRIVQGSIEKMKHGFSTPLNKPCKAGRWNSVSTCDASVGNKMRKFEQITLPGSKKIREKIANFSEPTATKAYSIHRARNWHYERLLHYLQWKKLSARKTILFSFFQTSFFFFFF